MVFATWQLVLIIIANGGLLRIVSKHRYDLIKWSQFSHFTTQSLKKNGLICTSFSSDPVGKSSSKENHNERRGCPRGVTPINVVIFCVWIVLNLWWPQTSQNLLSVLFLLSSGDCLTHWFSRYSLPVSTSSAAVRCIDISRTHSVYLGEQRWCLDIFC